MNESFRFGLQLTFYGMGLVFLLLALLWGLIALFLRLDHPPEPAPPARLAPASLDPHPDPGLPPAPDLLAAITVAVLAHRAGHGPEPGPEPASAGHWVEAGRTRQLRNWHPRSHA